MKKNNDLFDLFDDILSEIGDKVDETVNKSKSKNNFPKNKYLVNNKKANPKAKNSLEGQSMMRESIEGQSLEGRSMMMGSVESVGNEGQSIMTESLEGKSQMNYSLEGGVVDNKIYECPDNRVFKEKKIAKFLNMNSKDDLKRGIILSEILGKPKGLRD